MTPDQPIPALRLSASADAELQAKGSTGSSPGAQACGRGAGISTAAGSTAAAACGSTCSLSESSQSRFESVNRVAVVAGREFVTRRSGEKQRRQRLKEERQCHGGGGCPGEEAYTQQLAVAQPQRWCPVAAGQQQAQEQGPAEEEPGEAAPTITSGLAARQLSTAAGGQGGRSRRSSRLSRQALELQADVELQANLGNEGPACLHPQEQQEQQQEWSLRPLAAAHMGAAASAPCLARAGEAQAVTPARFNEHRSVAAWVFAAAAAAWEGPTPLGPDAVADPLVQPSSRNPSGRGTLAGLALGAGSFSQAAGRPAVIEPQPGSPASLAAAASGHLAHRQKLTPAAGSLVPPLPTLQIAGAGASRQHSPACNPTLGTAGASSCRRAGSCGTSSGSGKEPHHSRLCSAFGPIVSGLARLLRFCLAIRRASR